MAESCPKGQDDAPLVDFNDHFLGIMKFNGRYRLHVHDRDELFYVVSGRLEVEVEGEQHELGPGEAILLRKGEKHLTMSREETLVLVVEPQGTSIRYFEE